MQAATKIIQFPARQERKNEQSLVFQIEAYRRYLVGEGRREQGVARYIWGFRRFLDWFGEERLPSEIDKAAVQRYKEYLANEKLSSHSTILNALAILRDFSRYARTVGVMNEDPTDGIRRPPKQRPNPKPLYPHEIEELMEAIQPSPYLSKRRQWHWHRNRRLVYLMLYSGLRLSEAAGLNWDSVDLSAKKIFVSARFAKGGKERSLTIHDKLLQILAGVPISERHGPVIGRSDGQHLTAKGMGKIFSNWLQDELNFSKIHAHRLRHSFACLMLWNGATLKDIQDLLGHSQLGTTQWYLEADEQSKANSINRIPEF